MSLSQAGERSAPPDHGDGLWSPANRNLVVGLVLTITLVAFEALAVSTVMPLVERELGDKELYGWVFTAFMLGSLLGIVVSGGIIDRRGLGVPFIASITLFVIGLIIGGLAPSMWVLVVARFIQGMGAGAVPPMAYVAIGRRLPERLRPQMFATMSTAWVLPGVMGPAVAGFIGEAWSWRAVFLGLLPLIFIAAAIAYPAVRQVGPPSRADQREATTANAFGYRFPRAVLVAIGTGLVVGGLTNGTTAGFVAAAIGAVVGAWALRQLTPPGTLRAGRGMPAAILMRGLLTFAFFGVDAYVAQLLIEGRGQSAVEAGISLTAATLTWAGGSWVQARLARRYGPETFVRAGLTVVTLGLLSFLVVTLPGVTPWAAVPTFGLAGLGMGLAYAPLSLIVLRAAHKGEQGTASSALSLTDSLGTAMGTGVTGAFLAAAVRSGSDQIAAMAIGFGVAITVAVIGLLLSGRLWGHQDAGRSERTVAIAGAGGS